MTTFFLNDIYDVNFYNFYNKNESLIIKNDNHELFCFHMIRYLKIYLNKNYDNDDDDNFENRNFFTNETIYVKQILNVKFKHIRFICRLHLIRIELKISHFDREHIKFFVNFHCSFSYLFFINDFEIHRNMYRTLKTFYLIFANLNYNKRRKIVNMFILILKSHDATLKNVVDALTKFIRLLNKKTDLFINEQKKMYAHSH